MNKTYHRLILVGLFLYLAGTPALADKPPLTGITIDEELAQLLAQVVPYTGDLLKEKRFLFNLNKLINEDLKEQDEKYKLAAAKLAMRMALAINKTVDSIEVSQSPERSKDAWLRFGVKIDVEGNCFSWGLGYEGRDMLQFLNNATVYHLFMVEKGRIIRVDVSVFENSCAGIFDSCCGGIEYPQDIDDAWFRHFVDLGREADFPARFRIQPQVNESRSGAQ